MIRFLTLLSLTSAFFMNGLFSVENSTEVGSVRKKVRKEIKKTFAVESFDLEENTFEIPNCNFLQNSSFLEIHTQNDFLGYAFIGTAPSKTDSFEYLVLLNKDLVIIKAKVLVYREDYGGEIGSRRWLSQFISKDSSSKLSYGEEIVPISGATISVRSMTSSINHFLQSLKGFEAETAAP
ncbi:FMN-binding protein [Flavobacteriaceae bacterium]|nr:FMN-binding protein [Flavobacteriaceae bacterium]